MANEAKCGASTYERMGGAAGCARGFGHHGAHESAGGRRWHSFPGAVHGSASEAEACAQCSGETEVERARLVAGGALRPGQRMPADAPVSAFTGRCACACHTSEAWCFGCRGNHAAPTSEAR